MSEMLFILCLTRYKYILTYLDISVLGAGAIFFSILQMGDVYGAYFYLLKVCSVLLCNVFDT